MRSNSDWLASKEVSELLAKFRQQREKEENEGARIADDCFCKGCGARGYVAYCPHCHDR